MQPLLKLEGMTRSFPGVLANDRVDLELYPGEIHALLGENGAGKSTLVKMIYGVLKPDSGALSWNGEAANIDNPAMARSLGIAMVFQHFSLFDSLSVLENIALGMEHGGDRAALKEEIVAISNRYGLPLDPDRHVYTLSVGERQRIEIIRCLLRNPKLLVMDEPTSVLTPQEVTRLFETLRRLSGEGVAILYISHKLDEIKQLCEKATILREGRVVAGVAVADESAESLAARMMGEAVRPAQGAGGRAIGATRLAVHELDHPARDPFSISLKDINIEVRSGEIVGIAGVAGNGQDELLKALNGEDPGRDASAIKIDGEPCGDRGPGPRRALGMASIPEQRLGHGAVPGMSLVENVLLTARRRLGLVRRGLIDYAGCGTFCNSVVEDFKVRCNGVTAQAGSLSGGNLQKFIVGREINQQPSVLVVSQPTWGVDAGAARAIRDALRGMADRGAAILVISQDLDELMELTDRIAAICAGRLSRAVDTAGVSIERVGMMMAGVDDGRETGLGA